MNWLSTSILSCAAIFCGSAALSCTNGNGGTVFGGAPVDLCFPYPVADLTAPLTDFLGSAKPDSMLIFAWLSDRSGEKEQELNLEEKESLASLFFQDVASLTFTPLGESLSQPEAIAIVQVAWPAYGTHQAANCVIYLKDSYRLVYCGGVKDSQEVAGSFDLFKPTAEAVMFN